MQQCTGYIHVFLPNQVCTFSILDIAEAVLCVCVLLLKIMTIVLKINSQSLEGISRVDFKKYSLGKCTLEQARKARRCDSYLQISLTDRGRC